MKTFLFYIYIIIAIIIAWFLARPIMQSAPHPVVSYTLLSFFPVYFILRALVNNKYKEFLDYLSGGLLIIVILILRFFYL